jgi:hypothetical protein
VHDLSNVDMEALACGSLGARSGEVEVRDLKSEFVESWTRYGTNAAFPYRPESLAVSVKAIRERTVLASP